MPPYSKLYGNSSNKYCAGGFGSYHDLQKEYMVPNPYKIHFTYPQTPYRPEKCATIPCTWNDIKKIIN